MVSSKRLADIGYKTFSSAMILLTGYGAYLCSWRVYRFFQVKKQLQLAAENQTEAIIKD
ncbi:cytochrome c oxidase assembly protein COX14 [Eleutherodactylus coqui]|uniref:Cytochrome c oxidase assembly protein COX14 n=1 Tax=Eleutherodactylus coqui TaxID=57060 RepID=A0A8J6FQ34_ELECQ|nr:hypothetical protein GDO78_000365 [Eleutherodactylus coqui]KAG9491821.1 hypothetical protein GDO78_000365 [Eleutherodactylus coqui]KAG9491822.1 hypothetical protein GDO78_000365 [Eleutherodactylus coqui]